MNPITVSCLLALCGMAVCTGPFDRRDGFDLHDDGHLLGGGGGHDVTGHLLGDILHGGRRHDDDFHGDGFHGDGFHGDGFRGDDFNFDGGDAFDPIFGGFDPRRGGGVRGDFGPGFGGPGGGLFESGNRLQEKTALNDDSVHQLDAGNKFFDGSALKAAASKDKAAAVKLQKADQDFQTIKFDHAKNHQVKVVDQEKVHFNAQKGSKNFIDFDAKAAEKDRAAIKHDDVKKGQTNVHKKGAKNFDLLHSTGEEELFREQV